MPHTPPSQAIISRLRRRLSTLSRGEAADIWRLILCSAAVGILAGFGAIAFYLLLRLGQSCLMGMLSGYIPAPSGIAALGGSLGHPPVRRWVLLVLPAAGGLVSGWLVFKFAPEAEGHGTDAVIAAYHHKQGQIRSRVPFIKGLASAITIGTGGSAGAEGPIAQVGAGLAAIFARFLKLSPLQTRHLVLAGVAGGVGAVFRAPTAGAIFAAEVMYRDLDLEFEVLIPGVISAILAYSVFTLYLGTEVLFVTRDLSFRHPSELIPYLLMAFALALVGMAGFFSAAANTPISTIIMVSEITGNYHLLIPAMWVSIIAYVIARRTSIYEEQLPNRLSAPAHQGSMVTASLRNVTVARALAELPSQPMTKVRLDTTVEELLHQFSGSLQSSFPVVGDDGALTGIVREPDLRALLLGGGALWRAMLASDLIVHPVTVLPDDNLLDALRVMSGNAVEEILVVDKDNPRCVLGLLTYVSITTYYHHMLDPLQGQTA